MFRRIIPYVALLAMMLSGCTLEQRLASSFVKSDKPADIYLLQPSLIYKYNLKDFELPGSDTLDKYTRDSLLFANSLFLKEIDDSLVIGRMITGMTDQFKQAGIQVIPEERVDTLMHNGGTPIIVNLAQFSLEEYIHPFSSEEDVYDETVVIDGIDVNAINYNLWVELGRMNTETKNSVLFVSDYLTDEISGTIKQYLFTGKLSFDYTIDTITQPDIREFAYLFGGLAARYIFDYLMNNYIEVNLPEDYPYERYYYHYDTERKLIYPVGEDERAIELNDR